MGDRVIRLATEPGDLGWVVMPHGEVYAEQFGWDTDFEALVARIVADHATGHDPAREAAWVAEADGQRVGCVFCVADPDDRDVARLRILLVTPEGRGAGIGSGLVARCVDFARDGGYARLSLWTNDVLSARRIHEAAGFLLVDEEPHHSFGHDLVGRYWSLDLLAKAAGQ